MLAPEHHTEDENSQASGRSDPTPGLWVLVARPLTFCPVIGYAAGSVYFAHTRPLRFHHLIELDGVLYPMLGLLVGLSVGALLDVIAARYLTGSWRFSLRDVFLWTSLAAVWCWVGYVYLSLIREFYPTR